MATHGNSTSKMAASSAAVDLHVPVTNSSIANSSTNAADAAARIAILPIILHLPGSFGMTLSSTEGGESAMVTKVLRGSQADRAGVRVGDVPVVSSVGGMNVKVSYSQFLATCLAPVRPVVFGVLRNVAATAPKSMAVAKAAAPISAPKRAKVSLSPSRLKTLPSGSNVPSLVGFNSIHMANDGSTKSKAAPVVSAPPSKKVNILPLKPSSKSCPVAVKSSDADASAPTLVKDPPPMKSSMNDSATVASAAVIKPSSETLPSGTAAAKVPSLPSPTALIAMPKKQLLETAAARNIKVKKSSDKAGILETLGLPARQWSKWKSMSVKELKDELRNRNIKPLTGRKAELLERLGVPEGLSETKAEKERRETASFMRKLNKDKTKRQEDAKKAIFMGLAKAVVTSAMADNLKKRKNDNDDLDSIDDPKKEAYMEKCCDKPKFTGEPAGMVRFRNGWMSECWRCVTCGKIPERPNAPFGVEEFDSADEDEDGRGRSNGDCVIQ